MATSRSKRPKRSKKKGARRKKTPVEDNIPFIPDFGLLQERESIPNGDEIVGIALALWELVSFEDKSSRWEDRGILQERERRL